MSFKPKIKAKELDKELERGWHYAKWSPVPTWAEVSVREEEAIMSKVWEKSQFTTWRKWSGIIKATYKSINQEVKFDHKILRDNDWHKIKENNDESTHLKVSPSHKLLNFKEVTLRKYCFQIKSDLALNVHSCLISVTGEKNPTALICIK